MKIRKMTKDGDYTFGNNNFNFYQNQAEGVLQAVFTKLNLWQGDFYLYENYGVKWDQLLGSKELEAVTIELKSNILSVKGVKKITNFELDLNKDTRACNINIGISTIYGDIEGVFKLGNTEIIGD